MKIFTIRYECLDACDGYAQLKNGIGKSLFGSWDVLEDENGHEMETFKEPLKMKYIYSS